MKIPNKPKSIKTNSQDGRAATTLMLAITSLCFLAWISSEFDNIKKRKPIPSIQQVEQTNPIAVLINSKPSNLSPTGEIADIFSFRANNSDFNKNEKLSEIRGKIVEWELPISYATDYAGGYMIETPDSYKIQHFNKSIVPTKVYITPLEASERQLIENLKPDEFIKFRGFISDATNRNLIIKPAIIISHQK